MPPEGDLKKRVGRRLTKKRREGHQVTMDIPERFKDGDDADEDCTAPRGSQAQLMNQSVFGMIAAAGSRVDFNARFEGQSSDEDDGAEELTHRSSLDASRNIQAIASNPMSDRQHRRRFSDNKLMRSLTLKSKSKRDSQRGETVTSTPAVQNENERTPESPALEFTRTNTREAPVMSQMLEAEAQMSSRPSFDITGRRGSKEKDDMATSSEGPTTLSKRLKEIFDFDEPEEVIQGALFVIRSNHNSSNSVRIPMLAHEECTLAGLHVCDFKACLFLCVFAKESSKFLGVYHRIHN